MTTSSLSRGNAIALWIIAVVASLFFLQAASQLLIPIVIAVLISFALEPVVAWLARRRVPRLAGAGLVLFAILGLCAWGVYSLRDDARQALEALPKVAERARDMISQFSSGPAGSAGQGAGGGGQAQGETGSGGGASGMFGLITSLEGWVLEPPLMGKAERMSALSVFIGLLVWTWVWGAWGTLLAVPMLVVVKSVADRIEPLKPIGRLMAP